MNRFQRQFNKEVKQFCRNSSLHYGHRYYRKFLKLQIKFQTFSPCEDCDNPNCGLPLNKIVYCRFQN